MLKVKGKVMLLLLFVIIILNTYKVQQNPAEPETVAPYNQIKLIKMCYWKLCVVTKKCRLVVNRQLKELGKYKSSMLS